MAGGLELAAWCDLRVAAEDAVFGVYCRRWGIPLMDGGTIRLARLIGHSHALDLILTGRGVSGEEALRMGLANRLDRARAGAAGRDWRSRARSPRGRRPRSAATGSRPTSSGRSRSRTRWPASTGTGWTRCGPASWPAGSSATSRAPGARPARRGSGRRRRGRPARPRCACPWPGRGGRPRAASARWARRRAGSRPATPTEIVTAGAGPSPSLSSARRPSASSASRLALSGSVSGQSTPNSSPPRRAATSLARTRSRARRPWP